MDDYISHGEKVEAGWKAWIGRYKYYVMALVVIILACVSLYRYSNMSTEVVNVPDTSTKTLQQYFPAATPADARDISRQINRAKDTQAPTYVYYTTTQAAADRQAQTFGEQSASGKPDKIIKTTTAKEVKDENGKTAGEVIQNDYYAVNLNRKHDVKVGAAAVDGTAYATVSYRNRDVECTAYYNPATKQGGAGVAVTVAKW
jgi:hypothetical protein